MQLIENYRGDTAQDRINETLEEGWFVVAMTSYNDMGESRVIVVYQADEDALKVSTTV